MRADRYRTLYEYIEDVELMFSNAMTFNPKGDSVHDFAQQSRIFFRNLVEQQKKDRLLVDDVPPPAEGEEAGEAKSEAAAAAVGETASV